MSRLEDEISEIPERLKEVAAANRAVLGDAGNRFAALPPPAIFTIARGTSDAVAAYAAYRLTQALGVPVGSFAPSLASLDGVKPHPAGLWTLAISQSGQSPDLVAAQDAFAHAEGGGVRIALVNDLYAPLAIGADLVLDQAAGAEQSVAATKSFANSLMAVDLLAGALAGEEGEGGAVARCDAVSRAVAAAMRAGVDLSPLDGATNAYVIGRGASLPVASEAALKLKETCGLHAEAISAAEVMHGPRAIAGRHLPVLGFAGPGAAGQSVVEALKALAVQGSPTILVTADAVPERIAAASPIALIATFYAALPALARRRGRDPDRPPSLTKVTLTN
jgi:glucosamine--fructose-6-phosphate aminotransferase (isomerizing)